MSSILPYRVEYWPAPRHATQPPDRRQVHRLRPVPEGDVRGRAARPRGRGRRCPGSTSATKRRGVEVDDARPARTGRATRRRTRGMLDPHTPDRPATAVTGTRRVVTGGEHRRHLLGVGGPRHHGRTGRDRATRGPADGERPPVPPRLGASRVVERHLGAHRRAGGRAGRRRRGRAARGCARSPRTRRASMGVTGVGSLMGQCSCAGAHAAVLTGSRPARARSPAGPIGEGGWRRRAASACSRPHSGASSSATRRSGLGGGQGAPQHAAGAAGQDVVDGHGHLVAHRPQRLGPQVGQARDERLEELGPSRRPARARPGSRPRGGPPGPPGRPRRPRGAPRPPGRAARRAPTSPGWRSRLVRHRRAPAGARWPRRFTTTSTVSCGHPPVGGELAAGDRDHAVGRHRARCGAATGRRCGRSRDVPGPGRAGDAAPPTPR